MGREKGARSHVRKRRHGCLTGCLTRILLLLGVAALVFVGACVLGFVKNDPETRKPSLTLENIGIDDGALSTAQGWLEKAKNAVGSLPSISWAYGVDASGLTVKTLRAGEGEAVLVCCDGYTMLVGAGTNGLMTAGQLLLCGVNRLNVAVACGNEAGQIGGMATAVTLGKPEYLLLQDSQTKNTDYNAMLEAAQKTGRTQIIAPDAGLTFSLGRATVTVIGPAKTNHTDERDDGLSLRIDYGQTSVLILGTITSAGERELITSGVRLDADALICARGGSDAATCLELVSAVNPAIALLTGREPANSVTIRLQRAGAQVVAAKENGVMTLRSDGTTMTVTP